MKNSLAAAIGFILGGAAGVMFSYCFLKEKYELIAQEEIDSVREFYKSKERDEQSIEDETIESNRKHVDYSQYNALLGRYSSEELGDTDVPEAKSRFGENLGERPYVISPEAFGELGDYLQISLTYYADQILADSDDELVDDIDGTVGIDSLSHFGEYEDDSVFVRNDALKCDYEILLDHRKFSEVLALRAPTE